MSMEKITAVLNNRKLLFDGAFGTYYAYLYDTKELPELANIQSPERVCRIHEEYIEAGAEIIRTNTFAVNTFALGMDLEGVKDYIRQGYRLAKEAVDKVAPADKEVYIAADIGRISWESQADKERVSREYVEICRTFLEEGAQVFVLDIFEFVQITMMI